MTVLEFRRIVASKSSNRDQFTIPTPRICDQINLALKEVANKIIVRTYVVDDAENNEILRQVGKTTFIRKPKKVENEEDEIDIDEELLDAIAYRVLADNEVQKANYYIAMFFNLINTYDYNSIEYRLGIEEETDENKRVNPYI